MRELRARLAALHARHGKPTLGKGGALLVAVAFAIVVVVWLFTGSSNSDQDAVRGFLRSPAGGSAPAQVVGSVDVSTCEYTRYAHRGTPIFACTVTYSGVSVVGCFAISDDEKADGGWPVSFPPCTSIRWDHDVGGFVDAATGQPPEAQP